MIQIAICDDEKEIRAFLSSLIQKQNVECEIVEYDSTKAFLAAGRCCDLLLLDIEMKSPVAQIDGMALARKIRSDFNKQPMIIFVTGSEEYVYDAFDVDAFQYLLKPLNEKKFADVFRRAVQAIEKEKNLQQGHGAEKKSQVINIQYGGTNKAILIDNIFYIESYNHKIIMHVESGDMGYYARLSDLEQELAGRFYRIHKSYLINLSYVDKYSRNEVTLLNGQKLLISKYKYADFVKAYLSYMEKED